MDNYSHLVEPLVRVGVIEADSARYSRDPSSRVFCHYDLPWWVRERLCVACGQLLFADGRAEPVRCLGRIYQGYDGWYITVAVEAKGPAPLISGLVRHCADICV